MEGKVDQYGFPKMKNSQIIITEEVFRRLIKITQLSRSKKEEHMCLLYGADMNNNRILFHTVNQSEDYKTFGGGSDDPTKHGIQIGDSELKKELQSWIDLNKSGAVICDIHTHPSGINGDNTHFRMFSNSDLDSSIKRSKLLITKGIQEITGLIAVDRERGNSTISFVWYDIANNRFYRVENVYVVKHNKQTNKYLYEPLKKQGNYEYIEIGFNPVIQCSNRENDER